MFHDAEKSIALFDHVHLQWFSDGAPAPAAGATEPASPPPLPVIPTASEPALPADGVAQPPALPAWMNQATKAQREAAQAALAKDPNALKGLDTIPAVWERLSALKASSEGSIRIPNKDAPKEQWDQYRKALGIPESPEQYAFAKPNLPKGMLYDDGFEKWFKGKAFEGNVSQAAAVAMVNGYNELQIAAFNALVKKKNDAFAKINSDFQSKYGQEAPAKVSQMIDGFRSFATPGFIEKMKQFDMENDPDCIQTFVNIGAAMADDTFRGASRGRPEQGPPMFKYGWMEKDFPKQDS
jgi:hypothetical protein